MKKLLLCVMFVLIIVGYNRVHAQDIHINSYLGTEGSIDISYPVTQHEQLDKQIRRYVYGILKAYKRDYEYMLEDNIDPIDQAMVSLDCSIAGSGSRYLSIWCDGYRYVGGAHGSQWVKTFNYDLMHKKMITLVSLISKGKLKLISHNLYRYFVLELQAVDNDSKQWIKSGLVADYNNYQDFVIQSSSGSTIDTLLFYFEPYQLASYTVGSHRVKVAYPSGKIAR
ncbi:MAG TPA: DUF4163 domain-containing protein [Candidatus Absconditabacterales bacterium]|nr:DUF4163 domain-containing protein [Candidatus Absconditabacterales bacterium]